MKTEWAILGWAACGQTIYFFLPMPLPHLRTWAQTAAGLQHHSVLLPKWLQWGLTMLWWWGNHIQIISVIHYWSGPSFLSCSCDHLHDKSILQETFYWAKKLQVTRHHSRALRTNAYKLPCSTRALLFINFEIPNHKWCHPHSRWFFPHQWTQWRICLPGMSTGQPYLDNSSLRFPP